MERQKKEVIKGATSRKSANFPYTLKKTKRSLFCTLSLIIVKYRIFSVLKQLYKREERAVVNVKKYRPKLYVLDNGKMQMDKNLMVAMSNQATIDDPHAPNVMVEFPIYTVYIDHTDAKILFDTACKASELEVEICFIEQTLKAYSYSTNEEYYLYNRLEQIGLDAKEVDYVVGSHLHLVHAGCLEYFTNATVIVH